MKQGGITIKNVALLAALLLMLAFPYLTVDAQSIPDTYTNKNFWISSHDKPVSFSLDADGNFSGRTQTGKSFSQINITNSIGIRLQKFTIDEAFFYVSDKGIIVANTNAQALSVYLNRSA